MSSRARIQGLIDALLEVHRALIDVARADFERENGRVASSGALLTLLTEHEAFAWLRPLSSFVASIESASEEDEIAAAFVDARALFEPGSAFADTYYAALQRAPDAVMAHAALRTALH
ncbi:MAG TPA: hypothetical protein VM925_00930 [Labilithrix sp.]|nr:hypothetical protein [Labilithrix sp.]